MVSCIMWEFFFIFLYAHLNKCRFLESNPNNNNNILQIRLKKVIKQYDAINL